MIYSKFNIPDYGSVKESFVRYFQQSKGYRKNVHHISRRQLDRILDRWDFAMKEWGYRVPEDDLVITED